MPAELFSDDNGNRVIIRHAGPAGKGIPVGGTTGQILQKTGATDYQTTWVNPPSGTGAVVGPTVAVNNNVALFDTTTGKLLKDSGVNLGSLATNTTVATKVDKVTGKVLSTEDFTTALRIENAINREFGRRVASMEDSGTVSLDIDATGADSPAHVIAQLENLEVVPDSRARVVVDQRSGTIVMDEDVRISRVAIAQGNLTLRIDEMPQVVQPNPFAEGQTVVVPRSSADIQTAPGTGLAEVSGSANLSEVVAGLNALGVAPHDMIDILKSINAAGALHAEFVVN